MQSSECVSGLPTVWRKEVDVRVISQGGHADLPYEEIAICMASEDIIARHNDKEYLMARYSTMEKAEKAMEMLRTAYTGRFVTNADISDDFNEQLKELMKGGFGTVIVKDTNDSRVEFDNLNGYFQFPKDEDV